MHPQIRLKAEFPWSTGSMAKHYFIATLFYLVGSAVPVLTFVAYFQYLVEHNPYVLREMFGDPAHPNMAAFAAVVAISMVCGFSLQLLYIRSCFRKAGLSLRQAMGLNLQTLGGSWWSAIWRAFVAFALVLAIDVLFSLLPVGEPHDPAAEFAKKLGSGKGFLIFGLVAVVAAPLFEEIIFRGFLFNICRTSFRRGWLWRLVRSERMADYAAIGISATLFAAMHLTVSGFPQIFVMGCLLAALYRRSGSLICPILTHGLNNLLAVAILYFQLIA